MDPGRSGDESRRACTGELQWRTEPFSMWERDERVEVSVLVQCNGEQVGTSQTFGTLGSVVGEGPGDKG